MMRRCCLLAGALFLGSIQLVSTQTCPASGIPGLPGFPGFPGRDGRDGEKGEKGQPDDRLCLELHLGEKILAYFCDHRSTRMRVTSGGLAVYLSKDEEVWLETKFYRGMRGNPASYSVFSGFLLHSQ